MGAILDRFFAEYVAINHFTQTVVRTTRARRDHALAAAPRAAGRLMSFRAELVAEPWRFDLLAMLRRLERENPRQAARSATPRRSPRNIVVVSQNPYLEFPASNLEGAVVEAVRAGCVSMRDFSACSARRARCR